MSQIDLTDLAFFGIPAEPIFNDGSGGGGGPSGGINSEGRYWKFLTREQKERLEKIRGARMLRSGLHREYFLYERRTQFKFPVLRLGWMWGEADRQIYETYNVLGLISSKGADLLFGDEPILRIAAPSAATSASSVKRDAKDTKAKAAAEAVVRVQEQAQRAFLADLVDRCDLPALFHQKAEDASCDAEVYLEATIDDGEVWLVDVPSEEIFPVGPRRPDRQFSAYDRFTITRIAATDPNAKPIDLLLITHYKIGSIERECWRLIDGEKKQKISLDQWPVAQGEKPLEEKTDIHVCRK